MRSSAFKISFRNKSVNQFPVTFFLIFRNELSFILFLVSFYFSKIYISSQIETLLNATRPPIPPEVLATTLYFLSVNFTPRDLTDVESHSICPFMSGSLHSA